MLSICLVVISVFLVNAENSCGTWQDKYSDLHQRILKGDAPQRYLISIPPHTGLADKLVGLPGELMWAMLTNRAFQYVPRHGFPPYDIVFDIPNINITGPSHWPLELLESPGRMDFNHWLDREGKTDKRHTFDFDFNEYFPVCLRNNDSANTIILTQSDLNKYPPMYYDTKNLIVESNRGMTYRFFENPYHSSTLRSWGLTPENSFGCIMSYLFRIKEDGCDDVCQKIRRDMEDASKNAVAVIGIQVRIGDQVMSGTDETKLERAEGHLRCAEDIASQLLVKHQQKSVFYFMSDSISLLNAVKAHYGDRVLLDNSTRPVHTSSYQTFRTKDHKIRLQQHTTNQVFIFSKADYHVVSTDSGFGMMGAWMNSSPIKDRVFRVTGKNTVCKGDSYKDVVTDPRSLATGWSGI